MNYCHYKSPVGRLLLAGDEEGLTQICFPEGKKARDPGRGWHKDPDAFQEVIQQLDEYFAGSRKDFTLRLSPQGTLFQRKVWKELQRIPYGRTLSYGAVAQKIGRPQAARAVGGANRVNPIPIVIPCHRVIGSDGSLTGFGGGLDIKRRLLELEGAFGI